MAHNSAYLTPSRARARLAEHGIEVTTETVREWARTGRISAVKLPNGRYMIAASTVDEIATAA